MSHNFDIFISYRRRDAGDKAEHLKDLLESKYKGRISFDRENLTGLFDVALAHRIDHCKDFLLVAGNNSLVFDDKDFAPEQVDLYNYLGSCSQLEFEQKIVELGPNAPIDFVRIEIVRALHRKGLNIIPVVPETTDSFNFSKLSLPDDIVGIKRYEAVFYSDNPDALFKDIVPKILPKLHSKPANSIKKVLMAAVPLLFGALLCIGLWQLRKHQQEVLKHHILNNMLPVVGGKYIMGPAPKSDGGYDDDVDVDVETPPAEQAVDSFWMCKYEVSVSEWHKVMGTEYDAQLADLPVTNVSFDACDAFCKRWCDCRRHPICRQRQSWRSRVVWR